MSNDPPEENSDERGTQYASFIEAELTAETARGRSINSRAAAVLTGATGLVTLSLAVFAVFIGKDFVLQSCAKWLLGLALGPYSSRLYSQFSRSYPCQ